MGAGEFWSSRLPRCSLGAFAKALQMLTAERLPIARARSDER